ncbi:MAG: aspartate--tRNA ligase [Bacillus thermozeamaize]|uniref:Aspartate--tRNA ligase n=1 Tax=Bacillus thermozeamaize TaxID=230954 RepID=A0A1Y3PN39_9BACI|nr:MAG: aspartate--tRNA ligase [Bacillus thermozeamaize]
MLRTHACGALGLEMVGQKVTLNGWVNRRRDLGGVIFVDLRDRSGIVQVVFHPEFSAEAMEVADRLRNEYVIGVQGVVVERDPETVNPKLKTGKIEVRAEQVEILNPSKTPPFPLDEQIEVDEAVRLKYRYLDLRRPQMQQIMQLRHRAAKVIRDFLDTHGFWEIETPLLTRSTPEGARDFLVPSRLHEGEFFALPQSPQLYKQLLMIAGAERYYQIVRCFRDEDLRADRQPEFTQVDIETSFMSAEQLQDLMEEMIAEVFRQTIGVELERPFMRLSYREAMDRFGTDKPDLRFGMELKEISHVVADCQFQVFRNALKAGGQVKVLNAPGCAGYSRKEIDELGKYAARFGAKGLAWMQVTEDGVKSPIAKFFSEGEIQQILQISEAKAGDLLLFAADKPDVVASVLGNLRLKLAEDLRLVKEDDYKILWVTDFPLLSYDEEEKRYVAEHHPFTMPRPEDIPLFDTDPLAIRAQAYDMVLNGHEIGGGSMRIYQREVQEKMFQAIGLSPEEAQEKFGFFLEAFEYGAPPHGGIAFGFDRLVMLLAGKNSLRETIAFPKTANATELMTAAPSPVSQQQLDELHLRIVKSEKASV